MLNINELESRWLTYKIKSYIPHLIILLSVISIAVASTFIDFTTPQQSTLVVKEIQETITPIRNVKVPPIIIKKELSLSNEDYSPAKKSQQIIQPSLSFLNNIKGNSPQYYQDDVLLAPTFQTPKVVQEPKKVIQKRYVAPSKKFEEEVVTIKPSTIQIQRQNTYQDIKHVIKRFKSSNNPALSLFVAKKYYGLANYKQAYNYSLITNELNSEIEESWIIFAKSLVKLNKKNKAITILKKYIKTSHSQRAELLLNNIKSGKMR